MKNSWQIQWRRTIVESAAIVLSILLAFSIDAGWYEIRERNQEKAFLISLRSDFIETRTRVDESRDKHIRYIDSARQLLDLHGDDSPSFEPEALERMLSDVFFNFTSLYLPSGSRDALFASGDIEIIDNDELRAMLAAWPSVVADAAEDDHFISNDVMNNLAPYLQSKIQTRNVIRHSNSDTANHIPRIESVNYEPLWKDPLFEDLLVFRIANETFAIYENNLLTESVDEIIRVIDQELDR